MERTESIAGFYAPVHRALTEPLLLGGAPRAVAIINGTLAAAVGLGLRLWIAGAAICLVDAGSVRVLQIAAIDRAAARDLVVAAGGQLTLRLANVPSDDVFAGVLGKLGADLTVAQHEMHLALSEAPLAEHP